MTIADFHFLRPEWLWAILPVAMIIALFLRHQTQGRATEWAGLVDSHLLQHLAVPGKATRSRWWQPLALGVGLLAAALAMAGPTWQKLPVPAFRGDTPTVIVLSLAQSMNGTDLVPSRLRRAEHKLRDMLERAKSDDVALIIYSDQPFVAAPLTSDSAVIRQMLPELSTNLMPVLGNRLDLAIAMAQELLSNADAHRGRIIVLADDTGLEPARSQAAAKVAAAQGFEVSILGVGTTTGAQLQTEDGRAICTADGAGVTTRLDVEGLRDLAAHGGGVFTQLTADNSDIVKLMPEPVSDMAGAGAATDLTSDTWNDMGYLLVLIPVLIAPFAFRRGVLMVLPLVLLGFATTPQRAQASVWADLWKTPDQQAQDAFDASDFDTAAAKFTSAEAKGAALYRAGNYAAASERFQNDDYNRGNALAHEGKLEKALAAYDKAIDARPDDADAKFNRDLVAKLLEQQKQDEQQQKDKQQRKDQKPQQQNQQQQDQQSAGQQQQEEGGGESDQNQQAGQTGQQQSEGSGELEPGQTGIPEQPGQESDEKTGDQKVESARSPEETGDQTGAGSDAQEQVAEVPADQQAARSAAGNEAQDTEPQASGESGFSEIMDKVLSGIGQKLVGDAEPEEQADGGATTALDQAAEQQLRAVPDDPSGLLRARIRQHYARLRAASQ